MTPSAYATTTVPVHKSQGELRELLARFGAASFAFGEEAGPPAKAIVQFTHHQVLVRLTVAHQDVEAAARAQHQRPGSRKPLDQYRAERREQEERRIWRVLTWNVKARLVAVEEGIETFEQAFLAHIIDPSTNQTVYEQLAATGRAQLPDGHLTQLPPGAPSA